MYRTNNRKRYHKKILNFLRYKIKQLKISITNENLQVPKFHSYYITLNMI